MIILNQPNDIVKHLVPGTVLWRSTGISGARYGGGESASLHDVPFEKTDRGSYMARVNFPGQWKPEPEVWFTDEPRVRQRGLVVFIKQLPPSNWLYLQLTGVSKSGNTLFADFPDQMVTEADYLAWSVRVYRFCSERLNADSDKTLNEYEELALQMCIPNTRLVIATHFVRPTEDEPGRMTQAVTNILNEVDHA